MQPAVIESFSRQPQFAHPARCTHRATWAVEMATRRIVRVACSACGDASAPSRTEQPAQRGWMR